MSLVPTRRLALLGVALALALLLAPVTDVPILAVVAILTLILVLVGLLDALIGTSPAQLELTRRHPPVVVAGTEATLEWVVRSTSRRTLRVALADELAPSLRPVARRFAVKLPPGGEAVVSCRIRPLRRGLFPIERLTVRIDGRLGLGSRQREVPLQTVLRVHPPFRSRKDAELKIKRARILEIGLRSARGLGGGTEFEQMREYGPDDEFRRIDWTASARVGRTIVRTYRAERNQSVLIMLDNGRVMAGRVDGVPRVEHAMDAAMMLTAVSTALGDRCGMVAFDRVVRGVVPPARRVSQLTRVTEAMFALDPELSESDYAGAFAGVVSRFRRRTMLVLFTDLVDQAVEDSLIPALPMLTRTHLVLVAAVQDPQVGDWAAGRDSKESEDEPSEVVYRRSAAISTLAARRRTVARLRGLGATVVDVPPGRLATEVADAYLLAKGTGRL